MLELFNLATAGIGMNLDLIAALLKPPEDDGPIGGSSIGSNSRELEEGGVLETGVGAQRVEEKLFPWRRRRWTAHLSDSSTLLWG